MKKNKNLKQKPISFIQKLFRGTSFAPTLYTINDIIDSIKKVADDMIKQIEQNQQFIVINENEIEGRTVVCFLQDLMYYFQDRNHLKRTNLKILVEKISKSSSNLIEDIKEEIMRKNNIIGQLVKIWHSYIKKKYLAFDRNESQQNIMKEIAADIKIAKRIFLTIILQVFESWIQPNSHTQSKLYLKINYLIVNQLLTNSPNWKQNELILCKLLQKQPILMKKNKTPLFFEISPKYSCMTNQLPFSNTIQQIRQICKQSVVNKKLDTIKKLIQKLKDEIVAHQRSLILKKELNKEQPIDVDNIVACLEYCILMSDQKYLFQQLNLLELFYEEDTINKNGISHLIACLRGACQMLMHRDIEGKLKNSSSIIQKSSDDDKVSMLSKFQIFTVQFIQDFKFSHCFQYLSNRRIINKQPCWLSIFSSKCLPKSCEIRMRIGQTNPKKIMIGIIGKSALKMRQKYLYQDESSVCLLLETNQIISQGKIISNHKKYPEIIQNIILRLQENNIEWYDQNNELLNSIKFQRIEKNIYLHCVLNYYSEISLV